MAETLHIGILSFALLLLLSLTSAADAGNSTSGSSESVLINCGTSGTSTDGGPRTWSGDEGVSSPLRLGLSSTKAASASSQGSVSTVPYMTARISSAAFTYSVPVKADRYFVRLYFYPSDYGDNFAASNAVFDVACGPYTLLKNFSTSYYSEALNLDYIIREYSLDVSSAGGAGWLNITFTPSSNVSSSYAFVNGIELVSMPNIFNTTRDPTIAGVSAVFNVDQGMAVETMYRLNVGGSNVPLDQDSGFLYRQWSDDTMYIAGGALGITYTADKNVTIIYPASIPKYIAPVDVYGTARSMPWYDDDSINLSYNLSWILPVDPGFYYLVRLHFCEIQSTFRLPNQRVFTVYVNNHTAVQDFDVISRSNGIGVPVYYDSITVFPDGNEKVDLWVSLHPYIQFKPQYVNVILNGLEVFKLSSYFGNLAGPNPSPLPHTLVDQVKGFDAEDAKSKQGDGSGSVGLIFGVVGALMLISLLVYFAYYRDSEAVGCSLHDWLPLPVSSSEESVPNVTTEIGISSSPFGVCPNVVFAETKENSESVGLLATRNNDNDDAMNKDLKI